MLNSIYKFSFKLLLFAMLPFFGLAQGADEDRSDLKTWLTAGIKYDVNKRLAIGFESQLRLKENIAVVDEYFGQLEIEYEVFENIEFGIGLRYIRNNDNKGKIQGYENHFRWNLDLSYKYKAGDFSIKHRVRYQNKNELQIGSEEGDFAIQNVRFKTSVEYNIKKWKFDPKLSVEIFNRFRKDDENGFSKYRITLGTAYKLKKQRGKLGLFYRFEKELNEDFPSKDHIIGVGYTFSIKNKSAKKG